MLADPDAEGIDGIMPDNGMVEEGFACRELPSSGSDGDIGYAMVALLQIIPLLFSLTGRRRAATPIDLLVITCVSVISWVFSLILMECGSIIETVMTQGGFLLGLSLLLFAMATARLFSIQENIKRISGL